MGVNILLIDFGCSLCCCCCGGGGVADNTEEDDDDDPPPPCILILIRLRADDTVEPGPERGRVEDDDDVPGD